MPVVSITRLRVRSRLFVPVILGVSVLSVRQSRRAAGNIAVAVLPDAARTYWTCTIWSDEAAMKAFMLSGMHRRAMPLLARLCDEASVVRWTQADATPPGWDVAYRRMASEGRRSKIRKPSAAHEAFVIPAPAERAAPVTFK